MNEILFNSIVLIFALFVVFSGAELFTNGIEWLGYRLKLADHATGSILAAIGTVLPETMIPVVAIVLNQDPQVADEIGIGAIMGAPLMLSTVAFFLVGFSALVLARKRKSGAWLDLDPATVRRDLELFLLCYSLALLAGFLHNWVMIKFIIALFLIIAYVRFFWKVLTSEKEKSIKEPPEITQDLNAKENIESSPDHELKPLFLARNMFNPTIKLIIIQVTAALLLVIFGAKQFSNTVGYFAHLLHIPPLILSLIIAPLATELPECFNSTIWVKHEKDVLAMSNITGAMCFQGSLLPALGILMTNWVLDTVAITSGLLALLPSSIFYLIMRQEVKNKFIYTCNLICSGIFYIIFILLLVYGIIKNIQ